jgi:hypothetical protein
MAFDLAKQIIDTEIARLTREIDLRRAERAGLMTRRDEIATEIDSLQAQKDDLQAAKAALSA